MSSFLELRVNGGKTIKPIFRLKHAVQKLQRRLLPTVLRRTFQNIDERNSNDEVVGHDNMGVVVKGHFPVVTIGDGDEPKKFLVSLSYLSNPAFVGLLEEMETKFGNDQNGVLVVPCKASELKRIIPLKQVQSGFDWNLRLPEMFI